MPEDAGKTPETAKKSALGGAREATPASARTTDGDSFSRLVEVMRRLLAPDGCPWDREQTLASLRPFLVEETYEVLDAIDADDADEHREELGDLLMQIVFQAELRRAEGAFAIDDVIAGIVDKLVRRHPHVFGDERAHTAERVLTRWDEIKRQEREAKAAARGAARPGALAGVPAALPALVRAQKITRKASRVGFDWPDVAGPRAKIDEELNELDEAIARGDEAAISAELGDVLLAVVNLARKLDCDAETALRDTTNRFARRFGAVEAALASDGRTADDAPLEELDALWERAKARE